MLRSCAGHGARTVASPRTATPPHRGRRQHLLRPRSSAKKPPQDAESSGGSAKNALAGALPSKTALLRAGAVLFALGFVDAGYSGDWSRIGAISKDTEELLKLGAYAVVPLCLALALRVPGDDGSES
ncbi:hypothetical protein CFC21_058486 [Triticum aestivum]|uniref:DUF7887 domain-containing protein n=2 Tax=Triticum aestivum TaxID=4565 RepID=A0A3B6ITW3_WHEAT|nr:uncharacterized protein LOC119293829 [Triticum dicoccoides]XP_044372842.1 uncharacterized protein LOC123095080 [Triticum aestivum]KAF7050072.1 hypothetical protein CFC21_058486 [Triticum aestivum]